MPVERVYLGVRGPQATFSTTGRKVAALEKNWTNLTPRLLRLIPVLPPDIADQITIPNFPVYVPRKLLEEELRKVTVKTEIWTDAWLEDTCFRKFPFSHLRDLLRDSLKIVAPEKEPNTAVALNQIEGVNKELDGRVGLIFKFRFLYPEILKNGVIPLDLNVIDEKRLPMRR